MRIIFVAFLCGPLLSLNNAADEPIPQAQQINERIAAYHSTENVRSDRKLRFVYFLPSDREPAPNYRERLTRVLEETAGFYDAQIKAHGLKARVMTLDRDEDGLLKFVTVRGK